MSGITWLIFLLAIGLAIALYLFASVKVELDRLAKRYSVLQERLDSITEELPAERQRMTEQIAELQTHAGLLVPPPPAPSGLNLNKRSQAMRLLRTGTAADAVAADLQLPKSEVRLLRKVQNILATAAQSS